MHCDGLPGPVLVFPPPRLLLPGGGGPLGGRGGDWYVRGEGVPHWCIVVVFVAQLLWSVHQDDSSQVVAKQEAKEATDKRGEVAAAAEGRLLAL